MQKTASCQNSTLVTWNGTEVIYVLASYIPHLLLFVELALQRLFRQKLTGFACIDGVKCSFVKIISTLAHGTTTEKY